MTEVFIQVSFAPQTCLHLSVRQGSSHSNNEHSTSLVKNNNPFLKNSMISHKYNFKS